MDNLIEITEAGIRIGARVYLAGVPISFAALLAWGVKSDGLSILKNKAFFFVVVIASVFWPATLCYYPGYRYGLSQPSKIFFGASPKDWDDKN